MASKLMVLTVRGNHHAQAFHNEHGILAGNAVFGNALRPCPKQFLSFSQLSLHSTIYSGIWHRKFLNPLLFYQHRV